MNVEETFHLTDDRDDSTTILGLKDLMLSGDLLGTLDAQAIPDIEALMPTPLVTAVHDMAKLAVVNQGGTILLDSDGTNYLRIETGDASRDEVFYHQMLAEGRLMPGGAISGEVPQEFTYFYRVSQDAVEVWKRLASFSVRTGIFSGRKADQLVTIYQRAVDKVEGFMLLPSKGRVIIEKGQTGLLSQLEDALVGDPMGAVGARMDEHILTLPGNIHIHEEAATYPAESKDRERLTGYRVSRQKVNETVVLIRVHHRYRACLLACENGCSVPGIENPESVDGAALSHWLFSKNAGAKLVMGILKSEHKAIMQSWVEAIPQEKYQEMNIGITEVLGGRSLCHDFAPIINPEDVIGSIENESPLLLYGGDSFAIHGNDRPMMEALRARSTVGVAIAIHPFEKELTSSEDWMVDANQFQLFLAQYTLSRVLGEMNVNK